MGLAWPPECEAELTTYSLMTTSTYSPKTTSPCTLCPFWLWCQLQAIDGVPNSKGLWWCLTSWPKCILYSGWLCITSRPPFSYYSRRCGPLIVYAMLSMMCCDKLIALSTTGKYVHTYIHTSQKWTPILSATCLVCWHLQKYTKWYVLFGNVRTVFLRIDTTFK